MVNPGATLIDVLNKAWQDGFSVSSNFAREHSAMVAYAACERLITTKITNNAYGRVWRVTPEGLIKLFQKERIK